MNETINAYLISQYDGIEKYQKLKMKKKGKYNKKKPKMFTIQQKLLKSINKS
jgi:hypothetical protein